MRPSCVNSTNDANTINNANSGVLSRVEKRMEVQVQICNLQGLKIEMEIKNGRAAVELSLPALSEKNIDGFLIYLWDAEGELAFYTLHPAGEEDPCIIQLQHPHLWDGGENPYLYRLEIYRRYGTERERLVCMPFPVRELTLVSGKGSLLNGRPFVPKPVYYEDVRAFRDGGEEFFWEQIERRLMRLAGMGANILVLGDITGVSLEESLILQSYCDRAGLLLIAGDNRFENCISENCISGETLFSSDGCPSAAYYLQRARWSSRPFVYVHAGSLQRQSDGLYRITVYSNQQKVALFVNGAVFGFQSDGPEFVFQDIQAKGFPLLLAAEAGGSNMSVTCYR